MRLLTWVDKDSENAHLPRVAVNMAAMGGIVLALILFFTLPSFALAYVAFIGVMVIEIGVYLLVRHQKVGLEDLSASISASFKGKGKKDKEVRAGEGEVLVSYKGKPIPAPDDESPDRLGYDMLQEVIGLPLRKGASRIEVAPSPDGVHQIRYFVDGYPYAHRSMGKAEASAAIGYMRQVSGMDINDKRRPQKSSVRFTSRTGKNDAEVTTAGSSAGEMMVIELDIPKRYERRLGEMGFSEDQLQTLQASIDRGGGIVLAAAPKGHGLTSLLYGLVRAHDAFVYHIQTVEREPPAEIEGVTQNKLPANASAADEFKQINWVVSNEPDVLMVGQLDDPRSAMELIKLAKGGKRVYIGVRAGSTFDALAAWRKLVGDDRAALGELDMIVSGRVVRQLCMACKVAYTPDPDALRKMNLSPDRVKQLFQARTQPLRDQRGNEVPCEFCGDLRFKGRFGVYETLVITDEVRNALAAGGSSDQLKALFRKQRQRYLQEMALARVESGDTSIQEVLRVLRGESSSSSTRSTERATA
jgi:type II secretory ATPase GspE/PulE/Tfp pilus assembly ATPase PilB-like protein